MDNNLQQAITLIKSGDKKGGGQLLAEIVKNEPRNINAWLWLSSCVCASKGCQGEVTSGRIVRDQPSQTTTKNNQR